MNDWIINHPHVIVSPIINDCAIIKVSVRNEKKSVTNIFLKISVREIQNKMVRPVSQGALSEAQYRNNNIIISNSLLM